MNKKHLFICTPDAGGATAIIGNTPSSFNQVWNLPTDRNVLNGKDFMALTAIAFCYEATT